MIRSVRLFSVLFSGIAAALVWLAPAAMAKEPPPIVQLAKKMNQPVDFPRIDNPKTTLSDALDMLAKKYDLCFEIREKAFEADQIPEVQRTAVVEKAPIPRMTRVRLSKVLQKILDRVPTPSGAVYVLRRDCIEITTGGFRNAEFYRHVIEPANPLEAESVPEGVDFFSHLPLVQVEFDKRPLGEALQELADAIDWNVILDPRAAEKAKPVTITLINVPGDTAVEYLADMADLVVVMRDRSLYVTTRENAARRPFSQTTSPTLLPGGIAGLQGGAGLGGIGGIVGVQGSFQGMGQLGIGGGAGLGGGIAGQPPARSPAPAAQQQPSAAQNAKAAPSDQARIEMEIAKLQEKIAKLQAELAQMQSKKNGPKPEKGNRPEAKGGKRPDAADRRPRYAFIKPRDRRW